MTMRRFRLAPSVSTRQRKRTRAEAERATERRLLLESLEERRLLASGPRLTGLQPNNSDLFSFSEPSANVRSEAPRELTIRFDENQQIDPNSLAAIRIQRGGSDGIIGNQPSDTVIPGFIGVGDVPRQNEIVVRFAEPLPDDVYRIEIFGAGSATPLRNVPQQAGEAAEEFVPTLNDGDGDTTKDTVYFELDLGPQVVAVVPQPISRNASGALVQARNQIQVYFNNDDLLKASDSLGRPLSTSAENPNFYQLIYTADTVRNTDDVVIHPTQVSYDPATDMATLTFAQNLDRLLHPDTGALIGPGNFRLRIGTDEAAPLPPMALAPVQEVSTDFNTGDAVVAQFTAVRPGEQLIAVFVTPRDLGGPSAPLVRVIGKAVAVDVNSNPGNESTAQDVINAINNHPQARKLLVAAITAGDPLTKVGDRTVNYSPLELGGLGDSFNTATNLADDTDEGPVVTVVGGGIAFVDGESFEITDTAGVRRKFEFDSNVPPIKNDSTAIGIPFSTNDTQADLANTIVAAINGASFQTRAILAGNEIRFTNDLLVDISGSPHGITKRFQNQFDNGQVLELALGGDRFAEGQTFQIVDANGNVRTLEFDSGYTLSSTLPTLSVTVPAVGAAPGGIEDGQTFTVTDGTRTVTFEFDSDPVTTVTAPNVPIRFNVGDSAAALGQLVADAINQQVTLTNLVGLSASHAGGGVVGLRATTTTATAIDINPVGLTPLTRRALDGQIWRITQGASTVTFEFTHDNTFVDADATPGPDHTLIRFSLGDAPFDIGARIADAIRREVAAGRLTGLNGLDLKDGRVHLGGTSTTTLDLSTAAHLSTVTTPSVSGGNIPVVRADHPSFTANDMAAAIATAINAPGGPFLARALAAGSRVRLHQERYVRIPAGLAGITITQQGRFDAGPSLRITQAGNRFQDGQTIRIRDDQGTTVVLEFDSDGSLADPTASAVAFNAGSTQTELAERLADAINDAGFRVVATLVGDRITLTNDREVTLSDGLTGVEKTSQGLTISSSIDPLDFLLDFPGNADEPGHRNIPAEVGNGAEQHINADFGDNGRDNTPGVTTILYNFRSDFGQDPAGNPLQNAVTEGQKQRARDAFSLWSKYLGVQFVESEREGLTIATGDLRALDPSSPDVLNYTQSDFRVRIDPRLADGLLVMDSAVQWNDNFGGDWFINAMIGIGSMLGLDRANDLPNSTLMAFTSNFSYPNAPAPEPIYPGNFDILHGQHLYRPDGVDVDIYRFTIDVDPGRTGTFTAEAFAERLPNSSLLDTVLTVYRENPDGTRELIARNDDYFSRDSFVELTLGAGVYYIAVSAGGNTSFDPTIEGSGLGGTSQGAYDLRLNFRSQVDDENSIRDADGVLTALDGDLDGTPGGVYNFWFQTRPLNRVLTITSNGAGYRDGQVITVTNNQGAVRRFEFDNNNSVAAGNIRIGFTSTTTAASMATTLAGAIAGAAGFGVAASAAGNTVILGDPLTQAGAERSVSLSANFAGVEIEGRTIFVDKLAGPNADGSLGRPFNNIAATGIPNAFAAARPEDIVRIVGNGGTDGSLATVQDNFAYEIGFGTLPGQVLSDGTEMAVPKGVTVMIDPGSIFKMRRSRVGVGSSSLTVDRSGGALQVLGTPDQRVIFTSWLDESIGRDTHSPPTTPNRGDWGGIVFRADVDSQESRPNLEDQGIFLNYVNHADLLYGGGGNVIIDSVQQVVNPIQMLQMRPTVTFNRIQHSADSAMSASPNSFIETNFHSPRYQSNGVFTSDYDRVGPEIRGNLLTQNSENGLFIRIETPAGNTLLPLSVSGRFDDIDIVHMMSENLVIAGSEGEPYLDLSRPAVQLVTFSHDTNGTLAAGTYAYKITFVDENGFEGRSSLATSSFTITPANVAAGQQAIRLNQLPPAGGDYVARRIYRTDDPVNGTYRLVAQLNASDTVFTDRGGLIGDVLRRDPPLSSNITLAMQQRGSLAAGTYNYRVVFVDSQGREGAASDPTADLTIPGAPNGGGIVLGNLPVARGEFVARRIYRSREGGVGPYELVAEIDASTATYVDDGYTLGGELDPSALGVIRARPHARLAIDPGTVVKMEGGRIETRFGGQLIAEGLPGQPVVITSRFDDSYGAGGTFDTNDDNSRGANEIQPLPGDWGGLYFGPLSSLSLDHALVSYGGGQNRIEGTTTSFNVIELHQAEARITNSIIEHNANGIGGQGPLDRFGRGFNMPATIFVRGSQPVIVDNIIRDNVNPPPSSFNPANGAGARDNAAITINLNSLTHDLVGDPGRSRGFIDLVPGYGDNRGPLIRDNRLDNNGINGMVVRGGELTTQSVWDDTDIVHVLTDRYDDSRPNFRWEFDEVLIPDMHTFGGVRLQSSPNESLVVKVEGRGNVGQLFNLNPTDGAGFTATGRPLEIEDRIGGALHVVGQPGFPVVITSIHDDTVGAGVRPNDLPQVDTNNNGIATTPSAGDWRSIRLDQFSHDRNVEIITELEQATETAPGRNATIDTAQFLGQLAPNEKSGDNNLRMGFEVQGFLNEGRDIDVFSFSAAAGTEVWVDIDRTTFSLDTVIELLDSSGTVLARSNDSILGQEGIEFVDSSLQSRAQNLVNPLERSPVPYSPTHASGLPRDYYSTNPRDAGMRVSLPGNAGTRSEYHFRVRSDKGLTSGVYQFQVRMREFDEFPGSTVRFADIRYAQNGVEVIGHPAHSPLLGEASEDEELDPNLASNNSFNVDLAVPGRRPQDLGNLFNSDRGVFSIGGSLSSAQDIDFYRFQVDYDALTEQSIHHGAVVFDLDYADSLNRPNTTLAVFDAAGQLILIGRDSNIAEDRPGPLAGSDLTDLSRGSVGPGDPFIGPAQLPEGTYYVAVVSNDRMPELLQQFTTANPVNPAVRLEPVNSVIRIAEDHIESSGGSTAGAPVVPRLLDPALLGPGTGLWQVTTNRQGDVGHGINPTFDGSRGAVVFSGDVEPNNTLLTSQDINNGPWNTSFSPNIGDFFGNTSLTLPHITIDGTGDGSYDYYSFDVTTVPARLILDVDFGDTGGPGSFDADLGLWDAAGNLVSLSFDSPSSWGAAGSVGFSDPYLETTINTPGRYTVGIASWPSFPTTGGFTGPGVPANATYQLNVSLEGHAVGTGGSGGGQSFYFGNPALGNTVPNGASGTLDSRPFSLAGYSASDLPVLYFNYYLNNVAGTDDFTVSVVNSAGTATMVASGDPGDVSGTVRELYQTFGGTWRQARVDLSRFAGQDDLRLRFHFAKNSTASIEGAYVDDLIIGFAERGEMVTGGSVLPTFVRNPDAPGAGSEVLVGDYQLEIRKANEYGRSGDFGTRTLILDKAIDTNDRLAQQTTLIAPSGAEVIEEQTFTVSDGVNSITFEYEDPEIGNGVSQEGRVEIRFKTPDATSPSGFRLSTNYEIARRIRDAINSPQVQTQLAIRAALSDGTDSGTASRDHRVNLFGGAIVEQSPAFGIRETTNDANQLRDTILGAGLNSTGFATYTGSATSAGIFQGGENLLGMQSGIVLSTGDVRVAAEANTNDSSTGRASGSGDPRLDGAFGVTTRDASILEFDFTLADSIRDDLALNFVFASEEYNERVGSLSDVLAIFLDGVDITDNIAVVPVGGIDRPVSINTIHSGNPFDFTGGTGVNANLYRNNDPSDGGQFTDSFGYDGFTAVLTARLLNLDPTVPHRITIAIADVDDSTGDSAVFVESNSLIAYDANDPTGPDRFIRLPAGIENVRHVGYGDQNVFRDQGQILIHSNTIRDTADFGIVTTAGVRDSIENAQVDGAPVARLQSHVGPTRRLRDLNDLGNAGLLGGFTPGVVIQNNTISGEGLGGIHVSGNLTPLELTIWPSQAGTNQTSGDHFCDGDVFSLTVGRQTTVYEFVDVSGSPTSDVTRPCWIGGGGNIAWTPGRVPIFYRRTDSTQAGYSPTEMAWAIKEAIDNSQLIENQTTHVAQAYITTSRASGDAAAVFNSPNVAVYVERVAHYDDSFPHFSIGNAVFETQRFLPIGYAAQPFAQVVNNTIYGNDGRASFFPETPTEPDDTLAHATRTLQGRAHNPEIYTASARIGDSQNFRGDPSQDVDFYQFHLDINDRVTISIDSGNTVDTVLRLFNSVGEELAVSDNPSSTQIDPFIDFVATEGGAYYVAVSGAGNVSYSPISLADRQSSTATGDYDIAINVQAPRQFLVDMEDLLGGATFDITDLTQRTVTITAAGGANTAVAARNLVALINGSALSGVRASTVGARLWNYHFSRDAQHKEYERYVVIEGAVKVVGQGGAVAELIPSVANNEDQLLRETGILVTEAATPTLLNNVLVNLRNGVIETAAYRDQVDRFHHRDNPADDLTRFNGNLLNTHPVTAVKSGLMFQHNQGGNQGVSLPPNSFGYGTAFSPYSAAMFENIERYDALIDTSDFNIPVGPSVQLFVDAGTHNFFPAPFAPIIDSSIDTLGERSQFQLIKTSAGIALSPILAPDLDAVGQLRVDDRDVDTPQGQGANVFKDRGSLDRSDFVGPGAVLLTPRDNDADGIDLDSAVSTVELSAGVYTEFTIQIVDGFESADPFPGVGVNDNSLDGRVISVNEGGIDLTLKGPAVTLFQDGVYLREGLDYTYRFDRTSNTIRLTPLTGVWPSGKVYVIKVNNRDRFVIDAAEGRSITDGQTFQITNDVGDSVTMEFESGYSLRVTPTLGVQIPLVGAGPGGIVDGQRFTVEDGENTITFEFDRNGNVLPGNLPITYTANATADQIADAMVTALLQASVDGRIRPLVPRNIGGGFVHLGATPDHRFDFANTVLTPSVTQRPFSLIVPAAGGAAIQDNETFTISDTVRSVTFEFDSDNSGPTVPGSVIIPFLATDSAEIIAGLIRDALVSPNALPLGLAPVALPGGVVELNATPDHRVNVTGSSLTRTIFVGGVRDGERLEIRNGNSAVAVFEFDNNGQVVDVDNDNVPDFIVVPFTQGTTHLDIAQMLVEKIAAAGVGLTPANVGDGLINLGGTVDHTVNNVLAPSLQRTGRPGVLATTTLQLPVSPAIRIPAAGAGPGGIVDGETFSISDGIQTVIFEFDSDLVSIPGNTAIPFFIGQTQAELSLAVASALQLAGLGLNTTVLGNGVIQLGATATHEINLVGSSLTRSDRIGTLNDGEFFTVDNGVNLVTFEFEDLAVNNGVTPGRTPILFSLGSAVDVVANGLAAALRGAGLNLNPTYANDGSGRVELGDSVRHLTNIGNAPSLSKSGTPGGAQAIDYRLTYSESEVAKAIVRAINNTGGRIAGVSSQLRGGSTVFVDVSTPAGQPANFTSGFAAIAGIPNFFLPAVQDLPGNRLKANQATSETQFTILLPGVDLDYGDIPDSLFGQGLYPTLFENNGARHVITASPLYLGASVDADADGQSSRAAIGDDSDRVIDVGTSPLRLTGLAPYRIQVPANGAAGIQDNATFVIARGSRSIRFEFDKNSSSLSAGSDERIALTGTETQNEVADKIVTAIHNRLNDLVLRPVNIGGGVVYIGGTETIVNNVVASSHTINLETSGLRFPGGMPVTLTAPGSGLSLTMAPRLQIGVPAGGGGLFTDGTTFTISDSVRPTVTFEFDNEGNFTPGNRRISFSGLLSQTALANDIVAAIQQAIDEGLLVGLAPRHLGGGVIDLGAQGAHRLDVGGTALTQTGPVLDGETFTISFGNPGHPPATFEFDFDANNVAGGNTRIGVQRSMSANDIASAIVTAIKGHATVAAVNAMLQANNLPIIAPVHIGEGIIDLDAPAAGTVPVQIDVTLAENAANIVAAGAAGGIVDGDSFTISDGLQTTRYEFDRNAHGVVTPGSLRIGFARDASPDQLAGAISDTINGVNAVITSASLGAGLSVTIPSRQEFVVPVAGGASIVEGAFFSIRNGDSPAVEFEFDNNGSVAAGRRAIAYDGSMSANDVANAIVAEIQAAITAGELSQLTPVNLGAGVVSLGATATHRVDGSQSSLIHRGPVSDGDLLTVAAPGFLPVVLEFDFDGNFAPGRSRVAVSSAASAEDMAAVLAMELENLSTAGLVPALTAQSLSAGLVDVSTAPGLTISSSGTATVAGTAGGVPDGQTFVFSDGLRSRVFEFDRAEHGSTQSGNVRVPFGKNATAADLAVAVRNSFQGSGVTITAVAQAGGRVAFRNSDVGGVPFQRVNDDDGVVFQGIFTPVVPGDPLRANLATTVVVTASGDGFLDAWIDWNQDGDFADPNEQVFTSQPVVAGENVLHITVPAAFPNPSTLPLGDTFARFRLSSSGGLQPTGLAVDGEVEDYRIRVISNERPELIGIGIPDVMADEDNETGEATPDRVIDASLFFSDVDILNGNGDFLTFAAVSNNPSLVTASVDGNLLALDFAANENGTASVTVTVTDHGGLTLVQTFTVTLNKRNLVPVAHDRNTPDTDIETPEDTPIVIVLTGDDSDPLPNEVQNLTFLLCPPLGNPTANNPSTGTLSAFTPIDDRTAQITFTPPAEFNGLATFTFCVRDDGNAGPPANLLSNPATVHVNVTRVNDAPVALSTATFSAPPTEDTEILITLEGTDIDPIAGQQLTFNVPATTDQGGTLTFEQRLGPNRVQYRYLPAAKVNGLDTFSFTVTDQDNAATPSPQTSAPATVNINLAPVNNVPVANDQVVTAIEDTPLTITLNADDGDPEVTQVLTLEIVTPPTHGTLSAINASGEVVYTPTPGYTGPDSFSYRVVRDDATAGNPPNLSSTGNGLVTIDVTPVNDRPTITVPATPIAIAEDVPTTFTVRVDDGDAEFTQVLTYLAGVNPTNGTIQFQGFQTSGGTTDALFRYTPNPNFNGTDSFTFSLRDNGNPNETSLSATIPLVITPVNDVPVANPVTTSTNEDAPIVITLSGNDGDPQPGENQTLIFEIVSQPTRGTLGVINQATRTVTYTPNSNSNGSDTFTYRVRDDGTAGAPANLQSQPATVSITINPLNDRPEFTAGPNVTIDEDAGIQTMIGWASNVRPGPLTATDEGGQTVTFTVTNNNNALFLTNGQPSVSSSGTLSFTPAPHANGVAVVTLFARDNGSGVAPNENQSTTQVFTITVNAVNDAPQFQVGPNISVNEDAGLQTVAGWARPSNAPILPGPANATDEVNQALQFNLAVQTTGNLSFVTAPSIDPTTGTLTYQTAANTNGTAQIVVTLSDNGSGAAPNVNTSVAQTFSITVNPLNDAPEFTVPNATVQAAEDAGLVRVPGFATTIRPGPLTATDENGQNVTFLTTVSALQGGLTFLTPPTVNAAGELSFQTAADKHGSATIVIRLQDNGSGFPPQVNLSTPVTATIVVSSVNDAPEFTVGPDQQVNEDSGSQTVLGWATSIRPGPTTANDEASQTVAFTVTTNNDALFSTLPTVGPNGTLSYTPAANASGTALVTVKATDSGTPAAERTQQFFITVAPVNDPPVVTIPTLQTIGEDTPLAFGGATAISVADIDANRVEVTLHAPNGNLTVRNNVAGGVTAADILNNGTSTVTITGSPTAINQTLASTAGLTYQGKQHYNGFDSIEVTANDLGNTGSPGPLTASQTVRISVMPVNDPPVLANPIADLNLNEDSANTLIELFPRVFNDPDIATDNDALSLRVVNISNQQLVSAVIVGTTLDLRLLPNQNGQAVVVLEATDRAGLTVQDTFTVNVAAVNDPPNAVNDAINVQANATVNLNVLANDTDVDGTINPTTVQITSAPNNATVSVNADGTIRFVPAVNFSGVSTFRYLVQDNNGAPSNEAVVTVTVNSAPVAANDQAQTTQGVAVNIDVPANDTDSDGTVNRGTVTITRAPSNGTTSINPTTGVVTYTPNGTFSGVDSFRYTIRDNLNGVSNEATVTISVTPTRFWQNQVNNLDVNADGGVSPIDVLQVVNRLNSHGAGALPVPSGSFAPPPYYDVNGDGSITPADALVVINAINSGSAGEGEGEFVWGGTAEEAKSGGENFAVLVAPTFSEYRYTPLAADRATLGAGIGDESVSRAGRSLAENVDSAVADWLTRDLVTAEIPTSGSTLVVEEAAASLEIEGTEWAPYESALDSALDELFGDPAEQ